jgi:hypothetical protein
VSTQYEGRVGVPPRVGGGACLSKQLEQPGYLIQAARSSRHRSEIAPPHPRRRRRPRGAGGGGGAEERWERAVGFREGGGEAARGVRGQRGEQRLALVQQRVERGIAPGRRRRGRRRRGGARRRGRGGGRLRAQLGAERGGGGGVRGAEGGDEVGAARRREALEQRGALREQLTG